MVKVGGLPAFLSWVSRFAGMPVFFKGMRHRFTARMPPHAPDLVGVLRRCPAHDSSASASASCMSPDARPLIITGPRSTPFDRRTSRPGRSAGACQSCFPPFRQRPLAGFEQERDQYTQKTTFRNPPIWEDEGRGSSHPSPQQGDLDEASLKGGTRALNLKLATRPGLDLARDGCGTYHAQIVRLLRRRANGTA